MLLGVERSQGSNEKEGGGGKQARKTMVHGMEIMFTFFTEEVLGSINF